MAKETYQDYQIWVLRALEDTEIYRTKEIREKVKTFFNYTEKELKETLPSGKNLIDDRITWATTYLHNAKAIYRVKRGYYQISDRGLYLLERYPDGLNDKILMQFQEFADYLNKSHNKKDTIIVPEIINTSSININKCLKEGNPIVEALGNGLQMIMIKTDKPEPMGKDFLLFPTPFNNHLNNGLTFKEEYLDFVSENIEPTKSVAKTEVKYFATVEYVIEDKNIPISYFDDFHIWTDMHIYDYLGDKPVYIWLLRVYKLKGKHFVSSVDGITYGNLKEQISLDQMRPVISDDEFNDIKEKFVSIEYNKLLDDKLNKILENQEKILRKL